MFTVLLWSLAVSKSLPETIIKCSTGLKVFRIAEKRNILSFVSNL